MPAIPAVTQIAEVERDPACLQACRRGMGAQFLFFIIGLLKTHRYKGPKATPSVSVVVPMRNERNLQNAHSKRLKHKTTPENGK